MAENLFDRVDVTQLECHFKWFNELNNALNGQWLPLLLSKQLHNDLRSKLDVSEVDNMDEHDTAEDELEHDAADDETENTRDDEIHLTLTGHRLATLSWRFTLILRNTFEKNFAEAFRISEELLSLSEARDPSQPQVHVDIFSFLLLSNQLNVLKEWRSCADCSVDENQVAEIATKVESLKGIDESHEAKAFIFAMKSNLSRDMQDSQLRVNFAKKAVELNPQCACWHRNLYLALRYLRRSTNWCEPPSQLEIDTCGKAYELASDGNPDNIPIDDAVLMAKLYAELLFTCRRGGEKHQQIFERAIKFARDAVRLRPNSKTMKMRLVTLLTTNQTFGRYRNEGYDLYDEVVALIRECEVGKCSSEVCHKLGKFYSQPKLDDHNPVKALEWFEKGLEAHIGNFPCFADMLKNSIFRRKSTSEIIEKIDTLLSSQSKRTFKCQLMFIKGFFLWSNDPEQTFQLWLTTMEEATDLKINFVGLATRNFCYIKNGNRVQALTLMNCVKFFMSRRELANSDDPSFTKLKNIVNDVIGEFEKQSRTTQDNPIVRNHVQHRNINQNWRK